MYAATEHKITFGPLRINGEYPVYLDDVLRGWVARHFSSWAYGYLPGERMVGHEHSQMAAAEALIER
jgi:hypothetical protein